MPIDLYVMDYSPPARAVLTTAQVLGLEVNKKSLNLLKQEHKEPEYLKVIFFVLFKLDLRISLIFVCRLIQLVLFQQWSTMIWHFLKVALL